MTGTSAFSKNEDICETHETKEIFFFKRVRMTTKEISKRVCDMISVYVVYKRHLRQEIFFQTSVNGPDNKRNR
jgi:hypothetical protein